MACLHSRRRKSKGRGERDRCDRRAPHVRSCGTFFALSVNPGGDPNHHDRARHAIDPSTFAKIRLHQFPYTGFLCLLHAPLLEKRVQRVIKEISFAYDVKAHDLYIEGINLMMRRYGKGTVADIAPDEET
jgi:hypothetical protein